MNTQPADSPYDVILVGPVFCDLIFTGLPGLPQLGQEIYSSGFDLTLGGGSFITGVALRRLGLRSGVSCIVGDDLWGRIVLEGMAAEGLDLGLTRQVHGPHRHITVALSYPSDRAFVSYSDQQPPLSSPAEFLADVPFRHLHMAGLGCAKEQLDLLALAKQQGATVSISCQWCVETMRNPRVRAVIDQADLFIPNEEEALLLTNEATAEAALDILADWTPRVALTVGPRGVLGAQGSARYAVPALPVTAIDTTGAGDSFCAGLIYGFLQGKSFVECLHHGAVCGSLSTTARGGTPALPWLTDVERWVGSIT